MFMLWLIISIIAAVVIGLVAANRTSKGRKLTRAETKELIALRKFRDNVEAELGLVEHGDLFGDIVRQRLAESYRDQRQELE